MGESPDFRTNLDPDLRQRLLKESQAPWRGLRLALWVALFGSACLGLSVMGLRAFAGNTVLLSDIGIQLAALILFGGLLWIDFRKKN